MWDNIKLIIYKLFGKRTIQNDCDIEKNREYAKNYKNIKDINFTSIFANKLSTLACTNAEFSVLGDNLRAQKIQKTLEDVWFKIKPITASALGYGGVVLIPYTINGEIFINYIPQSRLYINEMQGRKITQATVLSDVIRINRNKYIRWTDYELKDNFCVIKNRVTLNDKPIPINSLPEFRGIAEEIKVPSCDRLLLAYLKCPVDSKDPDNYLGVPITYGSEKIIKEIHDVMDQMSEEYDLKRAFIGIDSLMFDENGNLPKKGLFKRFRVNGKLESGSFFEVFSPEIRESAYSNRLSQLFELLEKSVGVSKGILTEPMAVGNTATEINRASYDTFALADDVRTQIERCFDDLAYAVDVLLNYYSFSPQGDYEIKIDWDYALIESSQESFNQLVQAVSMGAVSPARLNAFVTGQSLDDAQKEIQEINDTQVISG